ncbi:uncharacterized protein LOC114542661 [Dendronephthya gigantea]|uniref:uncharacterized protein LOC114542661 n=1 Tax=Dendronephthya gigantea TaxID=151771 RepID=UPI00106B82A7|nr:uncharacterized protein LOC114542661 [Dendronephthya gigantea]
MASTNTPKKLYEKRTKSTGGISRCRLCNSVTNTKYSKNLYRAQNRAILHDAESFYGEKLPQNDSLPHLICAPCERRLNNAVKFKKIVEETQRVLRGDVREKRCIDISPSIQKPPTKVRSTSSTESSRRRSLDFTTATGEKTLHEKPDSHVGVRPLLDNQILVEAHKELIEVARRSDASVLRERSFDGLSAEDWMSKVLDELVSRCPFAHQILSTLVESTIYPEKKLPAVCLIYGIIMFLRCHELSRIQRINSVLLIEGQAPVNLIAHLHKYGICLEPKMKYQILDDIGTQFFTHAAKLVQSGHKFVYVLDNIDWEEKAHDMRQDVQNKSVHAVATSIVFNRVSDRGLPDSGPQQSLKDCNVHQLVDINPPELEAIRSRYRILVAKILFQYFPAFSMFEHFIPKSTECMYKQEMSTKSDVLTMPILLKDEKKYSDCVDVLDQLEKWTHDIYSAAGICVSEPESSSDDPPTIGSRSRPDQPTSHVPPTASDADPLRGVKIPCFGDQLSRVRFAGAKDLRSGCHTAKQRLDHLYPFCIVDWHTKRSFLKTVFKKLYKNSGREGAR